MILIRKGITNHSTPNLHIGIFAHWLIALLNCKLLRISLPIHQFNHHEVHSLAQAELETISAGIYIPLLEDAVAIGGPDQDVPYGLGAADSNLFSCSQDAVGLGRFTNLATAIRGNRLRLRSEK